MAIDTSYVISYTILWIIEFVVFSICYTIYIKTKGASLAYKKWAIGTLLLLMGTTTYLFSAIAFECNDSVSTDKNEIHKIIGCTLIALGYFYVPVGVMYLAKDLGIGSIDENLIEKSQIIFFSTISLISIFFMVLFPFFEILSLVGVTFNFLYVLIWLCAIYPFKGIYTNFRTMNRCWLLIYIGMFASLASEVLSVIYYIIPEAEYPMIFSQLLMAAAFISGFFKLAKMVEAI